MSAQRRHHHFYDDKARREWQNPEAILIDIGLQSGFTFMDIGCNDGFFALPAARMVGKTGRVYGLDIDNGAIDRLQEKAGVEGLENLSLKVARAEDTVLCQACADIVFFGTVLHDFAEPDKVLLNAARMLKPAGKLVNLDWKKTGAFGPPPAIRFSKEVAARLIEAAGLRVETIKDVAPNHYIIIAGH